MTPMRMPPPGQSGSPSAPPGMQMPPPGMDADKPPGKPTGKASPEDAGVIRADEHCIDCTNYSPDSGECARVEGSYDPQDGCVQYFQPTPGEPDADGQGGTA